MRVVEPKRPNVSNESKRKSKNGISRIVLKLSAFLFLVVVGLAGYFTLNSKPVESPSDNNENNQFQKESVEEKNNIEQQFTTSNGYIVFSGNEFRLLYDNLLQPNLEPVELPPSVTGNDVADNRIREIAKARGYKLRSSPSTALNSIDGQQLQDQAIEAWRGLKQDARSDGINLFLSSGYRSVNVQRQLFNSRLSAEGVSLGEIIDGEADDKVNQVLKTTALPGYSKHHTGYTLDFFCSGFVFENFGNSPCFDWLAEDNYLKAKQYGFIPSYPDDADLQGPNPEAWEYVWVGQDLLKAE